MHQLHLSFRLFSKVSLLVSLLAFFSVDNAFAQAPAKIKVKATDGQSHSSARKLAYYYPEFKDGKVIMLNGIANESRLNYNLLSGEVEFINSKKDTFELDNMYTVAMITMGTDSFYYDQKEKALLKLLGDFSGTKLLVQERYELSNIRSIGAYGLETNSQAPNSSRDPQFNSQNKLKQNESLIFTSKATFYFSNQNGFLPANKSNILKLFPDDKAAIKAYMDRNKPNFKKHEDVVQLLQYVAKL